MVNFSFSTPLPYAALKGNQRVVEEAMRIGHRVQLGNRTRDQAVEDTLNGLLLQNAVFDELRRQGYNVTQDTPTKAYDIILIDASGNKVAIDVKGIFKPSAKNWCQTWWESTEVPKLGHDVVYLCFDCRTPTGAIYRGRCSQRDFRPSMFNTPPYVSKSTLRL